MAANPSQNTLGTSGPHLGCLKVVYGRTPSRLPATVNLQPCCHALALEPCCKIRFYTYVVTIKA